ncbi:thymidine phosphorylase [Candidatus Dojkabacteria bacterium]|jgi:AMP phosphorylase|nr:thymidine phosphorylase [Candidatus Dojkabacteria bacterium]
MSLYLKAKKLDIGAGGELGIIIHERDSEKLGINEGEMVEMYWKDQVLYAKAMQSTTEVEEGEVGVYEEIWVNNQIQNGEMVSIALLETPKSMEYIKKKILGHKLTEDELITIMKDIGDKKLSEVDVAFFMGTFFNPGFDEDETFWMTKGMADSGDILSFENIRNNGKTVVDKHSLGGIAGKAATPIIVPILASCDLVVPNTSTRAITSPSGTSDILETVMPVNLKVEEIKKVVKKTGACMVWGGAFDLAPADDVIIHAERSLHLESFQKVLVSIVAKKISMGISHIVIDIPHGRGTKVQNPEDAEMLKNDFTNLFKKFGIICEVYSRVAKGPDGNSIGPNIEMKETLKILERQADRSNHLEDIATDMAGIVLEMVGKAEKGQGKSLAISKLNSKEALNKFWEIAKAQGATKEVKSEEVLYPDISFDVVADRGGIVDMINNREIVKIAHSLGTPNIKGAGLYIHKMPGDEVKKGDLLFTMYSVSQGRLDHAKGAIDLSLLYTFV